MNLDTFDSDVLIIGAGPTGLAAACDARRHGLSVRIVDRLEKRQPYSKALVVHARTMEIFETLGCAQAVQAEGMPFRGLHVHTQPKKKSTYVDLINSDWGDTRYPFWLSVPQYEVERVLEKTLGSLGVVPEMATSLQSLEFYAEGVVATLSDALGKTQQHRAQWFLACDGGRSSSRDFMGATLQRKSLGVSFALADVHTDSTLAEDEGHMVLSDEGVLLIVPMPKKGVWRLIAQVDESTQNLDADGWNELTRQRAGIHLGVRSMGWNSRFQLSSGVTVPLRRGHAFLLGDAAHVHSPVGGQGLNTGVQDAHNLIWKLALCQKDNLTQDQQEELLNSYEEERHPIAVSMVQGTEFMTRLITSRRIRSVLRHVAPFVLKLPFVANRLGRGVGMLDLSTAGQKRLPNPEVSRENRLHDVARSLVLAEVKWNNRRWLVRPDGIVANKRLAALLGPQTSRKESVS